MNVGVAVARGTPETLPVRPATYLHYIDGLRCLAVMLVVLYHLQIPVFSGGFIGVDVFFVISGFLMTGVLMAVPPGWGAYGRFLASRTRRIVPAYLVCVTVVALLSPFILFPTDLVATSAALISAPAFLTNFVFPRQIDYFVLDAVGRFPLLHTWSLAVEWQFYLLFPAVFAFAHRFRWRMDVALVCLGILSFILSAILVQLRPTDAFYALPTRTWEFVVGALFALWQRPIRSRVLAEALGYAGLALVAFATVTYSNFTVFPGPTALLPCIGAVLVLLGASRASTVRSLLSARPFAAIGWASYSVYLWHWPIIVFAQYRAIPQSSPAACAALVTASLAAGFLSWRVVETPFRQRNQWRRLIRMAAGTALASALLGTCFVAMSGMSWRFADSTLKLLEVEKERLGPFMQCVERAVPADLEHGLCRIGSPSTPPSFLLFGDSHAGALAPGLDMLAGAGNVSGLLLAADACPPLPGLQGTYPPSRQRCRKTQDALAGIVERIRPSVIVLHGIWATYYRREPADFVDALDRTLADLKRRSVRVILISDVPGGRTMVPFALAQRDAFHLDVPVELRRDEVDTDAGPVNALLQTHAARYDASYIDMSALMCGDNVCPVEITGQPVYFDRTHLSSFGSRYAARRLGPSVLP